MLVLLKHKLLGAQKIKISDEKKQDHRRKQNQKKMYVSAYLK
jgi:hypothetical protein